MQWIWKRGRGSMARTPSLSFFLSLSVLWFAPSLHPSLPCTALWPREEDKRLSRSVLVRGWRTLYWSNSGGEWLRARHRARSWRVVMVTVGGLAEANCNQNPRPPPPACLPVYARRLISATRHDDPMADLGAVLHRHIHSNMNRLCVPLSKSTLVKGHTHLTKLHGSLSKIPLDLFWIVCGQIMCLIICLRIVSNIQCTKDLLQFVKVGTHP